jgi:hypothetical protein
MCALVQLRKIKSCPDLRMSNNPISPNSFKKELAVGTALAVTNILVTGHHHSAPSSKELEAALSSETITLFANLYYGNRSTISTALKLKKNYLVMFLFLTPFLVRMFAYMITELLL